MRILPLFLFAAAAASATPSAADPGAFTTGPVIEKYGAVADVEVTAKLPAGATLRHSFDVSKGAENGQVNRSLDSAARLINMLARSDVPEERVKVAVVVHGSAVHDVAGKDSASAGLVAALVEHGVRFLVCGQSAAYYGVETADLLPGVDMVLSAMTAHALLQQSGFTLNPF